MVTMSGGKYIRGPQGTGLLFGKRELIEAATLNTAPNHSIGRPQKVTKDEMVGLHTALKLFMESDDEAQFAEYREVLAPIHKKLEAIPGIDLAIKLTATKYHVPTLVIGLRSSESGRDPGKLLEQLLNGEPRVFMTYDANEDAMSVNPINLQPGEGPLLANRLIEVLS